MHGYLLAIDPRWLPEIAPKFYKRSDGKSLSKAKKDEKLQAIYNYKMVDDSWRISRRKG